MAEILTCRLAEALGHHATCAGPACIFWEESTVGGTCLFDHLDLHGREDLAGLLLEVREQLESRPEADRHAFYERLNAGKSD